ncbi:hypothetical protein CGLO_05765 [Colletotrichum gloeosporioides Cg-14]|nr:hypothetical protein CGLO_05765 [Colletotrichum gloeosporioides Cg-14]
MEVAQLS